MLGFVLRDSKYILRSWDCGEYAADLDLLELRQDTFGTMVPTIINEIVSVPSSSTGAHLDKPGPNFVRATTNRDRVIDDADRLRN